MRGPLTVRGAFEFYTALIKWLVNLGRLTYGELIQSHLLLNTKYGLFYTHASAVTSLYMEVYELKKSCQNFSAKILFS